MPSPDHHLTIARRAFLRRAVAFAGLTTVGSLLAACQQAAPPAQSTAVSSTTAPVAAVAVPKPTTAPATSAGPGGVLNFAKPGKVQTRDPQKSYGLNEFVLLRNVYEPLVDIDQQGKLYGVLAEKWTPSADGKVWTIKLREGVKFQDGSPFDADSVKATVARAKGNAKSGSRSSSRTSKTSRSPSSTDTTSSSIRKSRLHH